ncbi:OmpA family protein [Maritimibacter sp. HL-12]|uniref:OmpA family protein n=1 Tax=Maritimibacter sp. HL-12 TaxID=1162418 RepID=UPI000A0F16C6|nr:OmpA family protein [Maritimibacter sp. HL-12]SMH40818.1 OmpA-OmpF porin, OOP family [Maritimibacter sp. HL-12]
MSKGLGALVFVAGVAALGYWGAKSHAVTMEQKIADAAGAVIAQAVHPMEVAVSGRDITLTGTADTEAELGALVTGLDGIGGRRVVNAEGVMVLPLIEPYETALAKAADGSIAATGYAPTAALRDALAADLPAMADLPLGHGAPDGWATALGAGTAALAPLEEGSAALTGPTFTLAGVAATPFEDRDARAALDRLDGFDTVVAIEVLDPGIVDFNLGYDAGEGFRLDGIVPGSLGSDGIAAALGGVSLEGDVGTTYADLDGIERVLGGLGTRLGLLETFDLAASSDGISLSAAAMAGLDAGTVSAALAESVGEETALSVTAGDAPADGAERVNAATGRAQFAQGGIWMNAPDFEPSKAACTRAARETVEAAPIRFVTGSAELDPVSLATVNDVAGIIHLCTRDAGMRVVIGGHTDAEGDDATNYALSLARARAVRDALAARGIAAGRMTAMGYGETEPVADNDTEEGRAQNRRTTFEWPG